MSRATRQTRRASPIRLRQTNPSKIRVSSAARCNPQRLTPPIFINSDFVSGNVFESNHPTSVSCPRLKSDSASLGQGERTKGRKMRYTSASCSRRRGGSASSTLALAAVIACGGAASAFAAITGFGGSSMTGWTANGTDNGNAGNNSSPPTVSGSGTVADVVKITDAINGLSRSYFNNTPQPLTTLGWTADFSYTYTGNSTTSPNLADGIAFV